MERTMFFPTPSVTTASGRLKTEGTAAHLRTALVSHAKRRGKLSWPEIEVDWMGGIAGIQERYRGPA
jgi:hypothetical protein